MDNVRTIEIYTGEEAAEELVVVLVSIGELLAKDLKNLDGNQNKAAVGELAENCSFRAMDLCNAIQSSKLSDEQMQSYVMSKLTDISANVNRTLDAVNFIIDPENGCSPAAITSHMSVIASIDILMGQCDEIMNKLTK